MDIFTADLITTLILQLPNFLGLLILGLVMVWIVDKMLADARDQREHNQRVIEHCFKMSNCGDQKSAPD